MGEVVHQTIQMKHDSIELLEAALLDYELSHNHTHSLIKWGHDILFAGVNNPSIKGEEYVLL